MKLVKLFFSLILLIVIAGAGIYIAINHLPPEKVAALNETYKIIKPLTDAAFGQAAKNLPKNFQVGNVLGAIDQGKLQISTASGEVKPQPFEQARYTYCQQVVKDYESRYTATSSSAAMQK